MPILTPDNAATIIQGFTTGFSVRWRSGFESQEIFWPKFASEMPSGTAVEAYAWMDNLQEGGLREWVGERKKLDLVANDYFLKNKKYERTLQVPREDIEDDKFGIWAPRAGELGRQARAWQDLLLADLLENGESTDGAHNAFDGKPMFAIDHPVDPSGTVSGTYSNYDSNAELNAENFDLKRAAMRAYRGRDGNPRLVKPTMLIVPTDLETRAEYILKATLVAPEQGYAGISTAQSENMQRGKADIVVNPYLTNQKSWYLVDASKEVLPLVFQMRYAPDLVPRVSPSDPNVFDRDMYEWGVRARGVPGYSLPFLAYKSKWS